MTLTRKGQVCDTVDGFKVKLNRAAVETQKKRKGVETRPDVSPTTQWRYAKRLKMKFTTSAETSTTARLREEGGIRNFIVEAAICEGYPFRLLSYAITTPHSTAWARLSVSLSIDSCVRTTS